MFKTITIVLAATLLIFQVRGDLVQDASDLINQLRMATTDSLTAAFKEHIAMSMEIDALALETKLDAADDVIECVNMHATGAIDRIYKNSIAVTDQVAKLSYDEEKALVLCGSADEACINGVIESIKADIESVPTTVEAGVAGDKTAVDGHLEEIKGCVA